MAVSPGEARRVAELAGLRLADDDVGAMARELSGILEHIDALEGVRASKVEGRRSSGSDGDPVDPASDRGSIDSGSVDPSAADLDPVDPGSALRPDEPGADPLAGSIEDFAPEHQRGFFLVPGGGG